MINASGNEVQRRQNDGGIEKKNEDNETFGSGWEIDLEISRRAGIRYSAAPQVYTKMYTLFNLRTWNLKIAENYSLTKENPSLVIQS